MGYQLIMPSRTGEIFLASCLAGDTAVVSRVLKRNRRSWTGLIGERAFAALVALVSQLSVQYVRP